MFESTPLNPPDSIFGLNEEFKADSREQKVNLTVGVYQDESGRTPLMRAVAEAEKRLVADGGNKSYLPIDGLPGYNARIGNLIFGNELRPVGEGGSFHCGEINCSTAQTPGGTAALRVSGDMLHKLLGARRIWISNPTWANHKNIYTAAGLEIVPYEYLDEGGTGLDFERMISSLAEAKPGDGILLHTVCHNPTGVDLAQENWQTLFELIREKNLLPVFDFAYQGFGTGIEEDASPIRQFCSAGGEALIANSFSKNFGLYGERVGGITAVAGTPEAARAAQSQIKAIIRRTWSNPPKHGGTIVNTVLGDPELRSVWEAELGEMRDRIKDLRIQFVEAVNGITPDHDFQYVTRQVGMFSYSGLQPEQVARLKEEFAIYALGTGRINIAGLNSANLANVSEAIATVMSNAVA
ncbi:MAG: amino acid aminotransferase [Planctomycetota bacterium]